MNAKKFIFVNQTLENTTKEIVGTVILFSSETRPQIKETSRTISQALNIPIQQSPLLDIEAGSIDTYDYEGFNLVKEARTDTVIVIGNGSFLYPCLSMIIDTEKINQKAGGAIRRGCMRVLNIE
jgi:hypothetical protein